MAIESLYPGVEKRNQQDSFSRGLLKALSDSTDAILKLEKNENYIAYLQLLESLHGLGNNESILQEVHKLYDKIFYIAEHIDRNSDGNMIITVGGNSMVRLNDTITARGLPTVAELRNSTKPGILFSGVGALQIETNDGIRIPLLQRDSGAPTDAGKYTLAAGRADKSPGLTAYEEILEEMVLFGRKNGKMILIVPFLEDASISKEKAKLLVSVSSAKFINKLLETTHSGQRDIIELMSAELVIVPLFVSKKGESVQTVFHDIHGKPARSVIEKGIFPIHDTAVNTYEMVRGFSLDLTGFSNLVIGDGDGFGRNTHLFSSTEIQKLDLEKDAVASLRIAIELGVFTE